MKLRSFLKSINLNEQERSEPFVWNDKKVHSIYKRLGAVDDGGDNWFMRNPNAKV